MRIRRWMQLGQGLLAAGVMAAGATLAAAQARKTPYWASITKTEAMMRVGPSYDYPSSWLYRQRGLPVRVIQVLGSWRKVEDSTGTKGWMHVRLLGDAPTAIVIDSIAPLREGRGDGGRVLFRAEPGVVGAISECSGGWCLFDVGGKRGYVRAENLWGAAGR